MPEGRVVCVGDIMLDIEASLSSALVANSDTPAHIALGHGGAAANTAVWLTELGSRAAFCGAVGRDAFGQTLLAELDARGVQFIVDRINDTTSGMCIVLVAPDGERTMVPSAGANDHLSAAVVPRLHLTARDHLYVSGYGLLREGPRPAVQSIIAEAVRVGADLAVDAASFGPLLEVGADNFLSWLPADTLLLANAAEAEVLTGRQDPVASARLLADRLGRAIVKCGADGAVCATADGLHTIPGERVPVVDSTGAGDAFAAGLLHALLRGADIVTAVRAGNVVGARVVGQMGARPVR